MRRNGWQIALVVSCAVLTACGPKAQTSQSQGTPTSTPAATTTPTTQAGLGNDYCAVVIKVNTDTGTMVNKKFVPTDKWTKAQVQTLTDFILAHHTEFVALSPPELKSDIELEVQYWQAVKDAGYDMMSARNLPAGLGEAAQRITQYQKIHCGIE